MGDQKVSDGASFRLRESSSASVALSTRISTFIDCIGLAETNLQLLAFTPIDSIVPVEVDATVLWVTFIALKTCYRLRIHILSLRRNFHRSRVVIFNQSYTVWIDNRHHVEDVLLQKIAPLFILFYEGLVQ